MTDTEATPVHVFSEHRQPERLPLGEGGRRGVGQRRAEVDLAGVAVI
jgi:hypothetical protein